MYTCYHHATVIWLERRFGEYDLHDLVELDQMTAGVMIAADAETCQILTNRNAVSLLYSTCYVLHVHQVTYTKQALTWGQVFFVLLSLRLVMRRCQALQPMFLIHCITLLVLCPRDRLRPTDSGCAETMSAISSLNCASYQTKFPQHSGGQSISKAVSAECK